MLRGVHAAGVALCYGNNNGGACAAGSVRPLAPNVAQRAHQGLSAAQRGFPINPPSYSLPRLLRLQLQFHPASSLVFYSSPSLPLSLSIAPVYSPSPSLSLSSQFHSFFCPTKTAIHQWHLKANKTSSENAKSLHRNAIAVGISALRVAHSLSLR